MYRETAWIAVVVAVAAALAGCAVPERQWMKVNERYTTAEFQRDHATCSKGGKLDEACMRSRGWVDVSPARADKPSEPDASRSGVYTPPGQRGRY
jgi:hypothetical protein